MTKEDSSRRQAVEMYLRDAIAASKELYELSTEMEAKAKVAAALTDRLRFAAFVAEAIIEKGAE